MEDRITLGRDNFFNDFWSEAERILIGGENNPVKWASGFLRDCFLFLLLFSSKVRM